MLLYKSIKIDVGLLPRGCEYFERPYALETVKFGVQMATKVNFLAEMTVITIPLARLLIGLSEIPPWKQELIMTLTGGV